MTEQPQPPVGPHHELESTHRVDNTFNSLEDAVHTDQYEVAQTALGEVRTLRSWRETSSRSPFSPFYTLVEAATNLNRVGASLDERAMMVDRLTQQATALSPRVRDLYMGLLATIDKETPYTPQYEMTQTQLDLLRDSGDLAALQDGSTPWDVKLNRMQTRIETELRGRKALDRREKEKQKVEEKEVSDDQPTAPSPAQDESKPGMDEMERLKEGEQATAIWTISPAYGGYYKEQSFDTWDTTTNTWRQSKYSYAPTQVGNAKMSREGLLISTNLPSSHKFRIPIPYAHKLLATDAKYILTDQNGDLIIDSNWPGEVRILFEKDSYGVLFEPRPQGVLHMPAQLSPETEQKLNQIQTTRKANVEKARALASYTMRHLIYSNDSSYNVLYENHQDGYVGAIDQFKKADCDVANTYFAALCSKLDIPVRHIIGHMVKGKDKSGNSRITSGTGHAWTEVWDNAHDIWVRIDATPPGDPNMEQDQEQDGTSVPGDYGEQEAIGPTDEQLAELEKKLAETAEKLSYTQEEKEIAEGAHIELKEAREIVKEIQEAEETRLPNGERVTDVMAQLWTLVARSRMTTTQEYTGPIRKREGGERIENIVAHAIGTHSGEADPASRQKEIEQKHEEIVMSALQVLIGADKSGSMSQTVDGEVKWRLQRKMDYLILSSLDRAQKNLARIQARLTTPLNIQTQIASFRGDNDIDIDKPLSAEFTPQDKVVLWRSLGNQGYGNGDRALLSRYRDQIVAEETALKEAGQKSDILRLLFVCSDGEPDDPTAVRSIASEIGTYNTTVVGIGITEAAAKVPVIFNTPTTRGDLARDINDLPVIVAKHFVSKAVELIPPSQRGVYAKSVANLLAKFNSIGVQ